MLYYFVRVLFYPEKWGMDKKRKMNRIKDVLQDQGRNQTWLAEKLGLSRPTVNAFCQNVRQPTLDILFKVAEILGVKKEELLGDGSEIRE